jgi:hypothetical protein
LDSVYDDEEDEEGDDYPEWGWGSLTAPKSFFKKV